LSDLSRIIGKIREEVNEDKTPENPKYFQELLVLLRFLVGGGGWSRTTDAGLMRAFQLLQISYDFKYL